MGSIAIFDFADLFTRKNRKIAVGGIVKVKMLFRSVDIGFYGAVVAEI